MMIGGNAAKRQRDTIDMISELPDFILHIILSILDTKEACRASVLSKRWYGAWSSIPILDFQPRYFNEFYDDDDDDDDDDDIVQTFVGFIDKTMQRYSTQKYRTTKLNLVLPMVDEKLEPSVDKWIKIAVQNQIEELDIKILNDNPPHYRLPEVLFSAKSLKVLKCEYVELPYYETMELISLEYLTLAMGPVDEDMLQRIISFCPLVELDITKGSLKKISLPWAKKVNEGAKCFGSGTMQSNLKISPLRKFVYHGLCECLPWAWNMNLGVLKNLRKLEIACATITDDILFELAYGLVALESLVLTACAMLNCIKISSVSLKEFRIAEGLDLMKVTIDAPNLLKFWYHCEVEAALSLIRAQDHCDAHFFPLVESKSITTVWFVKLKMFLKQTKFFKSLVMDLSDFDEIVVEEEQLRDVVSGPPFKLRELKLCETSEWVFTESLLMAFLDGLFWICHPDVICFQNMTAKSILNILKHKVQCWEHPLKRIEVEGVDSSSLLSEPSELEIKIRLSWSSDES